MAVLRNPTPSVSAAAAGPGPPPATVLRQAARLRRRILSVLFLRRLAQNLTFLFFLGGTAVLLLRALGAFSPEPLAWGSAAGTAAALLAAGIGLRRAPSARQTAAFLDHWNQAGGLFLCLDEGLNLGDWGTHLPEAALPKIRWQAHRPAAYLALAFVYCAAALLLPARFGVAEFQPRLNIGESVHRLRQKIAVLAEEKIVPPKQGRHLERKLQKIQTAASGLSPAKTWESLDHLAKALDRAARERAEQDLAALESAESARTLAQALAEAGNRLTRETQSAANKKLASLLKDLAANPATAGKLPKGLLDKLENGQSLSPDELRALARALARCSSACTGQMKRLIQAKLVPAAWGKRCNQCRKNADAALLAYIEANAPGLKGCCNTLFETAHPGRGAPTRGRGDAPMTWKKETANAGFKFKEIALPPPSLDAIKNSRLLGVSKSAPGPHPATAPSAGGALDSAAAGGGSARVQKILPCHRRAVAAFFKK